MVLNHFKRSRLTGARRMPIGDLLLQLCQMHQDGPVLVTYCAAWSRAVRAFSG